MKKIPNRNSSVPNRNSSIPQSVHPEDIGKSNSKLVAEIFIKNKIIHDLTVQRAWKKSSEFPVDVEHGKLFYVLQKFKVDLEKAYSVCEQNSLNILSLEKQKILADEENLYLRSVLKEASIDPKNFKLKETLVLKEPQRVEELEARLRSAEAQGSELQKHVTYWTNVSKKSQEAKLVAEASQKVLEKELQELKGTSSYPKRSSQKIIIDNLEAQLQEKEEKIIKHLQAQEKIHQFSSSLEEAYASAEKLEKENSSLKENLSLKEKLIVDLKEQLSLLLEKDDYSDNSSESIPPKKYDLLAKENKDLASAKDILASTLDKVNQRVLELENHNKKLSQKVSSSDEVAVLEKELREIKLVNKKLSNDQIELAKVASSAGQEIKSLLDQLKEKDSIILDLNSKDEHSDAESLANVYLEDKDEKLDTLEKELSDSRDQILELTLDLTKAQEKLRQQKNDLNAKESEVNELNEKLEGLNDQVTKLNKAAFMIDEKDKQVIDLLDKFEKSYTDLENKSQELEKLQQDAKAVGDESIRLKNVLEEKEALVEAHSSDIVSLKAELESKEEAIQHFILQYGNLEQKNADLERELSRFKKAQNSNILTEMESLKERNLLLEENLNELLDEQKNVEKSSSQFNELKLQEKLASQALDLVQTELFETKEEVKRLESLLNASKADQNLLKRKIAYYSEKLETYELQLETADELVAASNSTDSKAQVMLSKLGASEGQNKILEDELLRIVKQLEETQLKLKQSEEKAGFIAGSNSKDSMLEAELEEKIKELAILENEHKNLGNLFSILKSELDAKDSESKRLKHSLDVSTKELEEAKSIVNNMKEEFQRVVSLKSDTVSDKKKIQDLEKEFSEVFAKKANLEKMVKNLQSDLSEMQQNEKSKERSLQDEISRLEKEIEAQISSLQRLQMESKEYKEKFQQEKQENESLAEFIKQADVPSLLIRVGFLEKQSSEYETKFSEALRSNATIKSQLADSEALIGKLQEEISAKDGNVFQAPQVLIEKQQLIDELSQFNETLLQKIETLNKRLEAADSERPMSMQPGMGLESVIIASKKQAEEAESAIEALSSEVSKAYEKINMLVSEKAVLEDEINNLKHHG